MNLPKLSWDAHDRMSKTWDVMDAGHLTWDMWEIADGSVCSPAISGADSYLGGKCDAFAVPYVVTDGNIGVTLTVAVLLDGVAFYEEGPSAPPVSGQAVLDAPTVAGLAIDSTHTLSVTASDSLGFSASRQYTFAIVEDLRKTAVYYLLRDDVPIARVARATPMADYTALGTHRYRIRAVDRLGGYADSNEITLETRVESTVLAPLGRPGEMVELSYRMDEPPGHENRFDAGTRRYVFEGRPFAVLERDGMQEGQWSVSFSAETREEYERVLALAREGAPAVYRDPFGNRAIVSIDALPVRFLGTGANFTLVMTQLGEVEAIAYD